MAAILIVDDDSQLRQSFERILAAEGHSTQVASSGEKGLELVKAHAPDLVIMDVRMPGMSGLETLRRMRQECPQLPVIVMTAFGTTDTAIEATRLGAYDFILKPFEIPDVLQLIDKALETGRLSRERNDKPAGDQHAMVPGEILGLSPAMRDVYKAIGRVAPTDALVLIRGESGTGKELVARALHRYSPRSARPFVVINCVAIPETLLESELFGYERGAFTGASGSRVGKIEQANRGTVFLDEIGDMPLSIQAKILRLLQEKKIERLGGRDPVPVDVRILAATNRDLEAAVAEGSFREDLYYRLKVVSLRLPPLRERGNDVQLLADAFLNGFAQEIGIDNPGISAEAREYIQHLAWPGNVRELGNTLQRALIFNAGGPISAAEVMQAAGSSGAQLSGEQEESLRLWIVQALSAPAPAEGQLFDSLMDQLAKVIIREALALTGGNRSRAAKLLGISRPTLLARIEKYKLRIEAQIS